MTVVEQIPANGVEEEIPDPQPATARYLLDTAIEKADQESPDGLFQVYVPTFDRMIVMRRLSFAEVTDVRQADTPDAGNRKAIHLSIVDPPFSRKEVDELMDNAKLLPAAIIINNAVNKINHLSEAQQNVIDAKFRAGQ